MRGDLPHRAEHQERKRGARRHAQAALAARRRGGADVNGGNGVGHGGPSCASAIADAARVGGLGGSGKRAAVRHLRPPRGGILPGGRWAVRCRKPNDSLDRSVTSAIFLAVLPVLHRNDLVGWAIRALTPVLTGYGREAPCPRGRRRSLKARRGHASLCPPYELRTHHPSRESQRPPSFANLPSHKARGRSADRRPGAAAPVGGRATSRRPARVPARSLAQSARRGRSPLGAPPRRFVGPEPALAKPSSVAHERCPSVSHWRIRAFRS